MTLGQGSLAEDQPDRQLAPLDFVSPGFRGLNTVESGTLMDPSYCTIAQNAVIDTSGRLAARQGASTLTNTVASVGIAWTGSLLAGATSATLTANWTGATGQYIVTFGTTSETRTVNFTNGSTAATWTPGLTANESGSATYTNTIRSVFEYNKGAGQYVSIIAWNGGISTSLTNPSSALISGTANVASGRWFFQNFNNKCIGLQAGLKPIVYSGSGGFAPVVESAGTAPLGGVGCAAFGRLWVVDTDLQTIKYSGLLDETDWSTTDGNAGLIDMHTIWSDGTDQVTAIFAFNASLVVCGTKHIVFFTDGRGSLLGMDPTQAYVFDILLGTGCVSQWSVDHIGEADVVFLSPNGLQSLQRLTQDRNNPLETLSKYNRDTLLNYMTNEVNSNISGCFNQLTGFYILGLPASGVTYCFDMRRQYQDAVGNTCSITTLWTMALTACASFHTQILYIARNLQGTVCSYSGYQDEGTSYTWQYASPWMNLGQQVATRKKMLKRITLILLASSQINFTTTWAVDFNNSQGTTSQTSPITGAPSQYGLGQYGISLYGGGSSLYLYKYPAHISGQYYQLGISCSVSGTFAIQQAQFAAKIGRIA